MDSIFTKIIKKEIPAYIIAEDENNIAFLDIAPLAKGHVLVVPKKQIDYIFDLEEDSFINLHKFSKKVAKAIEKAIPCARVGIAVIGLEVPHAHIHLVPINNVSDIDFSKEKLSLSSQELEEIANLIKEKLV